MVLRGSDGSISHCISTVNDMIFDSNCDNALKLSMDVLNWCVSSDKYYVEYVGVHFAFRLIPKMKNYIGKVLNGTNLLFDTIANFLQLIKCRDITDDFKFSELTNIFLLWIQLLVLYNSQEGIDFIFIQ